MAHIEIHALSVKLAGTFEAHVFFPEQEVEKAEEKFPVLWMIHEDGTGTFDLMRHAALMEKIAEEKKMFVIAPMISHSLATNMAFGTKNEEFLVEECPEIFRFLYPVSEKKEDNYIFGIHYQEVILPTPCLRLGRILPCLWQSFANAVAKSCQW